MSTDRSVRAINSSRAVGVGSYGYAPSITEETEFDTQVRARLNGEPVYDDSSPRFEDWSPEKQRAGYEGAVRADEKRTIKSQSADAFIALHSEFLDTEKNGKLMNNMLVNLFGDCSYSVDHFEAAYQALLVTDSLDIDKAEVVKQQQRAADAQRKAATKNRQERERLRNLSADELELMPLPELRALADRQQREDMQLAGERGGNGW